jgi:hypothetical protein
MAAVAAAGSLLLGAGASVAVAGPAHASPQFALVCDPGLGETLVNGTCVLPGGNQGQAYQATIEANNGTVDTFTIASGSLPPGTQMPSRYNAFGTIVATPSGGTLTQQGTFTFTVKAVAPGGSTASQAYSITVGPPLPLTITTGSTLVPGTVGVQYFQTFSYSGGVSPYTWSLVSGQFPPGLALSSPYAPSDNNSELSGTPTTAGTYTFTMKVTDGLGDQATQQFTLTIQN